MDCNNFEEEEEPQLGDKIKTDPTMSQAGQTACKMESGGRGLTDGRWEWNLAGWARLRPVIRMYHGPGQARSIRPDLAVPHSRELVPPAKIVGFEINI